MQDPKVIKQFIGHSLLEKIRDRVRVLKESGKLFEDNEIFHRLKVRNDPALRKIHQLIIHQLALSYLPPTSPSYCFLSLYREGKGICPVHVDKEYCEWTVTVCLNQSEPWPLYINSELFTEDLSQVDFFNLKEEEKRIYTTSSKEYLLEPGDAIIYSGTRHPHWRKQLAPGNFCDLVFFHFTERQDERPHCDDG
jgi:hypothetical protein